MTTVIGVDELCQITGVGPSTAQELLDKGYDTYEDLSRSRPMELHHRCGIVLSSTALIIDEAVQNLNAECPECSSSELSPIFRAWTKTLEDGSDTESDVVCDSCSWNGEVDDLS